MAVSVGSSPFKGVFSLFEQNVLTDFTITCLDGPPLECHRVVLAGASPTMRAEFLWPKATPSAPTTLNSQSNSKLLHDASHCVVSAIVESMYTGKFSCGPSEVSEAIKVADYLQMISLRDELGDVAPRSPLEPKDMLSLLLCLTRLKMTRSLPIMRRLAGDALPTISELPNFLSLDASEVVSVTECSSNPDERLDAIVRWISHEFEKRHEEGAVLLANLDLSVNSTRSLIQAAKAFTALADGFLVTIIQPEQNALLRSIFGLTSRLDLAASRLLPESVPHLPFDESTKLVVMVGQGEDSVPRDVSGRLVSYLRNDRGPLSVCAVPGGVFLLDRSSFPVMVNARVYNPRIQNGNDCVEWDEVKLPVGQMVPLTKHAQCVCCGRRVFVFERVSHMVETGLVQVYDIDTAQWSSQHMNGLPTLVTEADELETLVCVNERTIYAFIKPKMFLSFDVASSNWEKLTPPPVFDVHDAAACAVGDSIYLLTSPNDFSCYKLEKDGYHWRRMPSPSLRFCNGKMCLSSSETLLVVQYDSPPLVYNLRWQSWSITPKRGDRYYDLLHMVTVTCGDRRLRWVPSMCYHRSHRSHLSSASLFTLSYISSCNSSLVLTRLFVSQVWRRGGNLSVTD
eukprot:GHVN01011171.1.p1 GENE.GHVN01011171.1~~GHVN01011171.1.p1  ORF type:complete len:624 (+),score=72.74 GHVN01011171.1:173-2044(+)